MVYGSWCLTPLSRKCIRLIIIFFTPRYSWNIAKVGVKHQSINQSINQFSSLIPEDWDPIKRLKPNTILRLSQARTWISSVTCRGLFLWSLCWGESLVNIGLIIDHHYLNFLFVINNISATARVDHLPKKLF